MTTIDEKTITPSPTAFKRAVSELMLLATNYTSESERIRRGGFTASAEELLQNAIDLQLVAQFLTPSS